MKQLLFLLFGWCALMGIGLATPPLVPSFEADFANHLTNPDDTGENTTERVYDLQIDPNISLAENLRQLFYPSVGGNG
jgi:hypothetical protein